MNRKQKNIIYLILIALFYYIIAHSTILSWDDFRWGTSMGLERLNKNFDNYNGRYFGNYIILLMTRSYLAQVLIPMVVNTGIVFFIYKILDKKMNFFFIILLFLTMPIEIYRQTYGFMSGFANYNIAVFLILVIIYLIKKQEKKNIDLLWLFISGFSVQLFLENVSAVNLVLAIAFLLYAFFKQTHLKNAVTLFISTPLGTILMFSNSAYVSDETSRGLSNIDLKVIPETFLTEWSELFFKENIILLFVLAFSIYLISKKKNLLTYFLFLIPTYFAIRYQFEVNWEIIPTKLIYLEGFFVTLFLFLSLYLVYESECLTKETKQNFYFFFLLAGLYSGPLLTLTVDGEPFISSRNVLTTYVLLVIATLYLLIPFVQSEDLKITKIKKYIKIGTLTLMLIISSMSLTNKIFDDQRMNHAKAEIQAGKTEIKIDEIPFEKLYYDWDLTDSHHFMPQFKEYYEIPEDVKVDAVSLRNKYNEE